jgi:hypothetical protein
LRNKNGSADDDEKSRLIKTHNRYCLCRLAFLI